MPKFFTRAEAEALLPRLIPLLRELQALEKRGMALQEQTLDQQRTILGNGHSQPYEVAERRRELRLLEQRITERIQELTALGVLLKDLTTGLVDFPAQRAGREVYLCWRLGEPTIAWWHETEAGIAGRQPLADD